MKQTISALLLLTVTFAHAQQEQPDSLKPAVELNEVVVVDQSVKGSELGFYQSTRQDGVENIMQRMAGINMIKRGNYAPDVVMHGMASGQVGVTIDGMQVFGACTDRMDPTTSYIETNNLKSVSKTGEGTNQGCHSANIAGGVDLQIKEPLFGGGLTGAVGGGYVANGNGYNGIFNVSYSTQKWATNVNAVYRKVGNYTNGAGQEVLYSQFEKMNLATNIRYRVNKNQIARLDFILDNAYNIGYAAMPMDVAFAKAKILGASYQWYLKGFLKEVNTKVYYNFINHAMDDSQRPDVPIRMDMPGHSETWGAFVEGTTAKIGKQSFFTKLEVFSNYRHADMTMYPANPAEPPMYMLTWPDVRKTSVLAFVKDEIAVGEKDKITISARLQKDFNDIATDEGRAYLIPFGYTGPSTYLLPAIDFSYAKYFSIKHAVSAHVGYTSRGPTTTEQYGFYLFNAYDGYDYIGMPNILQENALKADLGYQFSLPLWHLDFNAFGYRIANYILGVTEPDYDAMTIGANGVRVYQNVGYANIYGADFTISGELKSWLNLMGKIGYTRGVLSTGENLPLIPPVNGLLSLKATYKGWQSMLEAEFATAQNAVNSMYGDQQTPAYLVTNFRVLKTLPVRKTVLSFELGVDNIFDVAYRNHLDWGGILRPGRNVYLQITVGF